ncbi:MAG: hypothetical protein CMH83_05960 [Nocardioides sp.]|nr:hypothetical protein [Nocardioides sp.]
MELPARSADLSDACVVRVSHVRLGLTRALEPGELVVVRDLEGAHRVGSVDDLDFEPEDTVYVLSLSAEIEVGAAVLLGAYERPDLPRRAVSRDEVERMLRTISVRRARATAHGTAPLSLLGDSR